MRRPGWFSSVYRLKADNQARRGARRNRLAMLLALVTVSALGSVFVLSKGTQFLMPGPLTSAHGAIEKCGACHAKSGGGKFSWLHGLVAGDPQGDSKACLTCHKMPETAFNPHGASAEALKTSTERLTKIAAGSPQPLSARAQDIVVPTHEVIARGLYCQTCHQEHQGANFNLKKISNEQCRSCHVFKFDAFDGDHPKFEAYPFKRRTRIVYDHAGHFGKHYPELAKKDPSKRIPEACSTCHNSKADKRVMIVAPFDQSCAGCHLDQIIGKGRVSGPKGIAFLTLPALDLQSLKKKNAAIGEWPEHSDAALTPFMRVMLGRNERGRDIIKAVDNLNLQNLADADDDQIKAVTALVWEIKSLFQALITGKASNVLADLNSGGVGGAKPSAVLVADLTATIARDVIVSAQQEWLPNLAAEISDGPDATNQQPSGASAAPKEPTVAGSPPPDDTAGQDAQQAPPEPSEQLVEREAASAVKLDPPACVVRVFGQCLLSNASKGKTEDFEAERDAANMQSPKAKPAVGNRTQGVDELPPAMRAGVKDGATTSQAEAHAGKTDTANAKSEGATKLSTANTPASGKETDQSDELLFPTEDELREIKAHAKGAGNPKPDGGVTAAPASKSEASSEPREKTSPAIKIDSDVDPESWAENGGWYRQDYAIFYRPVGHKDKFIASWLALTAPQARKGETSPAAGVFDYLTSKDAQGSCTKCHSVDDTQGKGRTVNFSPTSVESKQARFTSFIHEPHFGVLDDRGCLTCHNLEQSRPYLKNYEQSNPKIFTSNFGAVKKNLCQTCHTSGKARHDCLTCHNYHVNGVVTPITPTRNPTQ